MQTPIYTPSISENRTLTISFYHGDVPIYSCSIIASLVLKTPMSRDYLDIFQIKYFSHFVYISEMVSFKNVSGCSGLLAEFQKCVYLDTSS